MSEAFAVQCPQCHARLKLKNRSAIGKRVPCPKCKKPFVIAAPDDDEFNFMHVSEPEPDENDADEDEGDEEEFAGGAPATAGRSSSKKNAKRKPSASRNWQQPALVTGLVVAVVALLGGVGYVVGPLLADLLSGNKIDMAWLPPESDFIVHARAADTWKSGFVQALAKAPANSAVFGVKDMLGLDPEEIRSVTFGAAGYVDQMQRLATAARAGGMNAGVAARPVPAAAPGIGGSLSAITVLRMEQTFEPKPMRDRMRALRTALYKNQDLVYLGGTIMSGQVCFFPDGRTVVIGGESEVKAAIDRGAKGARRADLDFIDPSRHVVVVVAPKDPSALGGQAGPAPMAGQALVRLGDALNGKVKAYCLGLAFGDNLDVSAIANCTTPEAAKDVSAEAEKALQDGKAQFNQLRSMVPPQFSEMVVVADGILGSIAFQTKGNAIEVKAQIPGSIKGVIEKLPGLAMAGMLGGLAGFGPGSLSGPEIPQTDSNPSGPDQPGAVSQNPSGAGAEPADRARSRSNLAHIGLAMLSYEQANKKLPAAAIRDAAGKPLLSWRVALLPYLGQDELYKEFHLDEPWSSEHNKQLIARMPEVFASPNGIASAGSTSYFALTGPGSIFEAGESRTLFEIADGAPNTVAIVEANEARAVLWTTPEDFAYEPAAPANGLVGRHPGGFLVLTGDGSVHFISEAIAPKTLVALFTRGGGEHVDVNALP